MILTYIHGKFTTASRKAANVTVSGNSVFLSESSFRTYANYKCFWIFSNDEGSGNPNATSTSSSSTSSSTSSASTSSSVKSVNYTRYVATQSKNLNVRKSAKTSASIVTSLARGTKVTVTKVDGNWSYITSPTTGWVSSSYLSSTKVTASTSTSTSYKVKITAKSGLNIRKEAKTSSTKLGAYTYGTTVTITQTSNGWGKTSKGWIYLAYTSKVSTSTSSTSYSTTVGKTYTLKSRTYLYSKGNLSGTKYTYLANTKVKVIKHYSTTVDYVYISATKRYAYVKVSAFK